MRKLALALLLLHLPSACLQTKAFVDTVSCTEGLNCQLLEEDVLCIPGETVPDPEFGPVLVLTEMTMRNKLRCQEHQDCIPCVQVMLRLGLLESPVLVAKQDAGATNASMQLKRHHGKNDEILRTHILLSAQTYPSSHCVAVEVWIPHGQPDWHNSTLGFLHFDCFPVSISGELYVTAFTRPSYLSSHVLQLTHYGPDCTWHEAKDAIRLCKVPRLEISVGKEEAVLHVWDIPEGQPFCLWLYLNQASGFKELGESTTKLLTAPENVSLPISKVFPCLCLQVWPKVEDQDDIPRTYLCPFANNTEALSRAWAESHLDLKALSGVLSCSFSSPCDLPGELVPCWRGEELACHPLHPQLRMDLILHELQEFPGLSPHPNLCVQVISNGSTYLQSCLQEDIKGNHHLMEQHLLFWTTLDSQRNYSVHVLKQGSWVPLAQAVSTKNGILQEALQNDVRSGECMLVWQAEDEEAGMLWACSLEKYHRSHWVLAWMITLFGLSSILFVLLLKKEALKEVLQGRHILILYSSDHKAFERLVGTLAGALTQLQLSVSLELWSRGELGSLGPMQWLHAQRHQVLEAGGTILLLFSPGAVAGCAEWLGWKKTDKLPLIKPDNTFLASLNCILPDFQAGKSRGKYMVACFEELLAVNEIPGLFHSVPIYPLPSQLLSFLLALAGPVITYEQRSSLRRHAVWISKSLERAVLECQQNKASFQYPPLLPDHSKDGQIKGNDDHLFIVS
ncbi:interleukin-17 receptor C isoform X2 [Sceloporus undulatus]|uniref:interleukin-17 receptor C isoform X2 n=1 Tax=Sceloporus undulatus TaxID=8520 RepID=UPI001C4CDD62|nr:interleukin-17 receptor C isoform X2 [Sceloporus undulatus]